MVLTRAEKEEFIELINNTLKSYLSSCELDKKISTFEILSEKIELSLNTLTQNYEAKIANLEKENIKLHARMNELEQYSRRNSIRLYGVKESPDEDVYSKVIEVFNGINVNAAGHIDRCHRVGKKTTEKQDNGQKSARARKENIRCIIIKFTSYLKRHEVFKNKRLFKNSGFSIVEDLTSTNYTLFKKARNKFGFRNVWTHDGLIYVNYKKERLILRSPADLDKLNSDGPGGSC